jgi:hypothetical protein
VFNKAGVVVGVVVVSVTALVVMVGITACAPSPAQSPTAVVSTVAASVSTTAVPLTGTSSFDATSDVTDAPESTIPIPGLEAYSTAMTAWTNKYIDANWAVDTIEDVFSRSQHNVDAVQNFANLLDSIVGDLRDIKPPADLSSAHAEYVTALEDLAPGLQQVLQAYGDENASTVDAWVTLGAAFHRARESQYVLEDVLRPYGLLLTTWI